MLFRSQTHQELNAAKTFLAELTQMHRQETTENTKVLMDSQDGLAAINEAISFLTKFYEGADEESLLQQPSGYVTRASTHQAGSDADGNSVEDLAPETYQDGYNGNQEAAKGIMSLLSVIESDFQRTIDSTDKEQTQAVAEFEEAKTSLDKEMIEKNDLLGLIEMEMTIAQTEQDQQRDDKADADEILTAVKAELSTLEQQAKDRKSVV